MYIDEKFETVIGLIEILGYKEYEILDDNLIAVFKEDSKGRYQIISSECALVCDEDIQSVTKLTREIYVLELCDFKVEDELSDCFDFESEKKAVLIYDIGQGGKVYTNCEELRNKYELRKDIELESVILYKGEYYTRAEINNLCRFFISHKKEELRK